MNDSLLSFFYGCLFWGVVLLWIFLPESWINPLWYGLKYSVDGFNLANLAGVHTSDKPSDCDWTFAPLGRKGCHYDRVVTAYNAAGDLIAVDAAMPKRGHNKDGQSIISYDGGKTWKLLGPATIIKKVDVDWLKVTE
jgi:hypothetical protein